MRLLILTFMTLSNAAVTAPSQLDWSTHYGQAKTKATSTQRPLLVVIENPHRDSARLDETSLGKDGSQLELMKRYELCRVDASTTYGKRVAEAFGVGNDQLPYTAITDKSVRYITYRNSGQMTSEQWTKVLKSSSSVRQVRFMQSTQPMYYSSPSMSSGRFCRT